VGTQTLSKG